MRDPIARVRALLRELKRRNVYKVAVTYAAVAFVTLQAAQLIFPATTLEGVYDKLVVLTFVGFPIALVLAWAFEMSSEGVRRTPTVGARDVPGGDAGQEKEPGRRRALLLGVLLVGTLTVGGYTLLRVGSTSGDGLPEIRSLAVLPLDNLSGDPEQEYFTVGMTEAVIAELAQIGALKVISRTSAMHYRDTDKSIPEIARELDVDALVEGSVLRAGEEVRITLQLIHGATDRHLWAKSYERGLRDVLALQGEVARRIAREIQVTLTSEERERLSAHRSVDPEAYRRYLMGNDLLVQRTESAYRQAVQHYQDAIAVDPGFAPAYAALALAYIQMVWWLSPPAGEQTVLVSRARKAAQQALARDSTLAEAHIALGRIRHLFEWDWEGAETAFRHGIALNPSATSARLVYASYLLTMGRFDESVAVAKRAVERDPLSPAAYVDLAFALDHLGRHAEAQETRRKALELAPGVAGHWLGQAESYAEAGRFEEALSHAARADSLLGGAKKLPVNLLRLASVYAKAGRRTATLRILDELQRRAKTENLGPSLLALVHAALGREEQALDLLEQAYEERGLGLVFAKGYYMYDPLRDEPRFQDLLRRMNFPEP